MSCVSSKGPVKSQSQYTHTTHTCIVTLHNNVQDNKHSFTSPTVRIPLKVEEVMSPNRRASLVENPEIYTHARIAIAADVVTPPSVAAQATRDEAIH